MRGALAGLALGVFALVIAARWPLLARPFTSEGEAREAHVIADVVREGHWLAPYPNGDWIPTKGPLLYWWAGAAATLFGLSERVLRLSVVALNAGTILATAWLGRSVAGATAGGLAALVLASCVLFSGYAFYLRVDPALLLCTTLCLGFFARELARPETAPASRLGSHLALAGALFAKGLPALIPSLLPILAVLAWRRDRAGLRCWGFSSLLLAAVASASVSAGASAVLGGLALCVALAPALRGTLPARETLLAIGPGLALVGLVGGWLALADARYPVPYLTRVVLDSTSRVGRAAWRGDPFLRPFWWYLLRFPGDFFPWTIFLPVALVAAARAVRRERRDAELLCLVCLVGGFALFSAIAYKRKVYLLPLFAPAAVLVAALLDRPAQSSRGLDRTFAVFLALGLAAACVAPLDLMSRALRGAPLLTALHSGAADALHDDAATVDIAALGCGALWIAARSLWRWRGGAAGGAAIALGMVLVLAGPMTALELANAKQARTPDDFAALVRALVPAQGELRFAPGVRDEGLLYYLARRVPATSEAELKTLLGATGGRDCFLIARRAGELPSPSAAELTPLARGVGSNGPLILLQVTAAR